MIVVSYVRGNSWARSWLGASLALLLGSACGAPEDERPPAPPSVTEDELRAAHLSQYNPSEADVRDRVALGTCEEGATQICRVYLPEHDGVQPCFVGEQTCESSAWSRCGNARLVDANADDAEIDATDAQP